MIIEILFGLLIMDKLDEDRFDYGGDSYKAEPGIACKECAFFNLNSCRLPDIPPCIGSERKDRVGIVWVKEVDNG
jgi:hypothetical protein